MKKKRNSIVVGWNEEVHLPNFDIWDLPAKIDTGAKTSSLHAEDIERLPNKRVRFRVIIDNRKPEQNKTITARIIRRAPVRTNSTSNHYRIFIKTQLTLGSQTREIEFNLADRSDLNYRLILGRTAFSKDTLINPHKSKILSGKSSKRKK